MVVAVIALITTTSLGTNIVAGDTSLDGIKSLLVHPMSSKEELLESVLNLLHPIQRVLLLSPQQQNSRDIHSRSHLSLTIEYSISFPNP